MSDRLSYTTCRAVHCPTRKKVWQKPSFLKKIRERLLADFPSYSPDLLELSRLLFEPLPELPEGSLLPPELLPELPADSLLAELALLSDELEPSDFSDVLALADVDSLFSVFAGRFRPDVDLWSVAYQPEPLKTIPAGVSTLRKLFLLHSGQRLSGSSVKDL